MDDRTLAALNGSIAKWQAIVAGTGDEGGIFDCPLCALFHPKRNPDPERLPCAGCPVMQRTGQAYCAGSPYDEWNEGPDNDDERIAKEELAFLISLLPPDEPSVTP